VGGLKLTPNKPKTLELNIEGIPAELKATPNWVLWRYEFNKNKWQKIPHQPNGNNAKSTVRRTWCSFETCYAVYQQGGYDGIGFVFDGEIGPDGLCYGGIDFDKCVDDNGVQPLAKERIQRLRTYTEQSPSGTGFHCICRTEPSDSVNYNRVEAYTTGRYFTVTGQGVEQIRAATTEFHALVAEVRAQRAQGMSPRPQSTA
jgi:putative DNA primase/helicase